MNFKNVHMTDYAITVVSCNTYRVFNFYRS